MGQIHCTESDGNFTSTSTFDKIIKTTKLGQRKSQTPFSSSFGSKKFLCSKTFLVQKKFSVQKKFWSKKSFWSKKILVKKNFLIQKKLLVKKKSLVPKKFLRHQYDVILAWSLIIGRRNKHLECQICLYKTVSLLVLYLLV